MDTPEPLLCVGGILYKGVLRPLIGTQMVFDKAGKYVGGAEVRVVFSRKREQDGEHSQIEIEREIGRGVMTTPPYGKHTKKNARGGREEDNEAGDGNAENMQGGEEMDENTPGSSAKTGEVQGQEDGATAGVKGGENEDDESAASWVKSGEDGDDEMAASWLNSGGDDYEMEKSRL